MSYSPGELKIQGQFVANYFSIDQEGLHFRSVSANTVSRDSHIIESDLKEYLSTSNSNKKEWEKALRAFHGDESALMKELISELNVEIHRSTNMAIFLRKYGVDGSFNFYNGTARFTLFQTSGSEIKGDDNFEENIFSIVFELTFDFIYEGKKRHSFRPDWSFFLNGFYIGYCELKSVWNNQSSYKHGRHKVIKDYTSAVAKYVEIVGDNDSNGSVRSSFLYVFEKAIFITTCDINRTFVVRNLSTLLSSIRQTLKAGATYDLDHEDVLKIFKEYPLRQPDLSEVERFDEHMKSLYSKKMLEREILYYNFLQYEWGSDGHGNKVRKSNNTRLISPRPKQKFGCDKIIDRIPEFLAHENDPDYYINKMAEELRARLVNEEQIKELVEKRRKLQNNKNIYSLLLQYAAGFGKSNIIGWTALQLKDLRDSAGKFVYDKIMIVVDRLQLRDQTDTMLHNMNINSSLFKEASNKSTFQKYISDDTTRVVVVNIQKFASENIFDAPTMKKLAKKRVVFIIDEVHRSNTGTTHEEMISLFDDLQSCFDNNEEYNAERTKKNLIIGFTATPSDETLLRFGEYDTFQESGKHWVPFDAYTMRQAINDGYILDPTKNIIPVSAKMLFAKPDEGSLIKATKDDEDKYTIRKETIYGNTERMRDICKFIAKQLATNVYFKIQRTAKAMLAVTSIPVAIEYKRILTEEYKKFIEENPKYNEFANAPIYIVYSDSQEHPASSTLNGGLSEEKVLIEFANCKNGIVIVVDKLQTGYDEPKLHSLFLDKEIRGINAIQTISRVDRTCYGKKDCNIFDLSWRNINANVTIPAAFNKFADVVISDFDPFDYEKQIIEKYGVLTGHCLYENHFSHFVKACQTQNTTIILEIQNAFRRYIETAKHNAETSMKNDPNFIDEALRTRNDVNKYFQCLNILVYIIKLDKKYKEELFLDFWRRYINVYLDVCRGEGDPAKEVEIWYDGVTGILTPNVTTPKEKKKTGEGSGKPRKYDIDKILEKLNKEEQDIEELIEAFEKEIEAFFNTVCSSTSGSRLVSKIKSGSQTYKEEELIIDFGKELKKYIILHKDSIDDLFKQAFTDNITYLYEDFLKYLDRMTE